MTNTFGETYPDLNNLHSFEMPACHVEQALKLPAIGEYFLLSNEPDCPVAISTLSDAGLAERLYEMKPPGLSIVGKTETENIGIEKIVRNTLALTNLRYLILCGEDCKGHLSGDTMRALARNGVDAKMRIIGSAGKQPVLTNLGYGEVETFQDCIELVDLIGCTDTETISDMVRQLTVKESERLVKVYDSLAPAVEMVDATYMDPEMVKLDRYGYFVVVPKSDERLIYVEHYDYENSLLRIIRGRDARSIYWEIINEGWVSELSHAAYLGKELERAELSMSQGFKYVQDKG